MAAPAVTAYALRAQVTPHAIYDDRAPFAEFQRLLARLGIALA
jgi:hypothetical protein